MVITTFKSFFVIHLHFYKNINIIYLTYFSLCIAFFMASFSGISQLFLCVISHRVPVRVLFICCT